MFLSKGVTPTPASPLHITSPCYLALQVVPLCRVVVSGVTEGRPENVLSADPDAWFETDESQEPMPWIQVLLPSNVRVVHFSRSVDLHRWMVGPMWGEWWSYVSGWL